MQSAAGRRVLSTLASKLHPQLPLSPRESHQLLTLLTTSFRAHLDREHPVGDDTCPSSYASATQHMDSILTNPLFAVKPRRRASEPAAVDVLRDPVAWFVDQIATGAATIPRATMCLELLDAPHETAPRLYNGKTAAFVLAEWLHASGLDTSREFVHLSSREGFSSMSMDKLLALLFAQGQAAVPWRWFIRSPEQRARETKLDAKSVLKFRQHLLRRMVFTQANKGLTEGVSTFMQAFRMAEMVGLESAYTVLRPAGAHLVQRIVSTRESTIAPELYQTFMSSLQRWLGKWGQAVEARLWLYHPTKPNASQGLKFLQEPAVAIAHIRGLQSRRHFLVQLCLDVARQLIEEERYVEAQVAMHFSKEHFPDLVLSTPPAGATQNTTRSEERRERREKHNLDLLDQLALT
ncbi:hypothetical protein BDU57DRAFT_27912 [Ampelomyces quisqualis]|uniref:Uncharacterized protein n=1 Tax=Ampelomyces quisqualis TaxID=50730 RepID=A0A6A5R1M1_AMPQU|nr:hypothetical protein BDU57DRAFT_27912 [Ampelomyces quisqualis]